MNPCCLEAVVMAIDTDQRRIHELEAQLAALDPEPVAVLKAQVEALAKILKRIVADQSSREFSWPARQALWREARALLVETGFAVGDAQAYWEDRT